MIVKIVYKSTSFHGYVDKSVKKEYNDSIW